MILFNVVFATLAFLDIIKLLPFVTLDITPYILAIQRAGNIILRMATNQPINLGNWIQFPQPPSA